MNWLAFIFVLEMAALPNGFIQTYSTDIVRTEQGAGSANIKLNVEATLFDYLFIGGGITTYMRTQSSPNPFIPVDTFYYFNAGVRFKFIEAGFRHYCMHPVVPFLYHAEISPQWEGAFEEIYLRFELEYN